MSVSAQGTLQTWSSESPVWPSSTLRGPPRRELHTSPLLAFLSVAKLYLKISVRKHRKENSQARQNNNTSAIKQSQGPSVPPQGLQRIFGAISLSSFADTETPTRWKKLTACSPQACRPQTGWNQQIDDANSWLPHHQPIRSMPTSWSHPEHIRLLTIPSRAGHAVLRALANCGPLWLAKQ